MLAVSLWDAIMPVKFMGWYLFIWFWRLCVSIREGWDIIEMWQLASLKVVVSVYLTFITI